MRQEDKRMEKKLLVVCGPSGAGLGEIVAKVFARRADTASATPVTARKPKAGETDGVGFWFYDPIWRAGTR